MLRARQLIGPTMQTYLERATGRKHRARVAAFTAALAWATGAAGAEPSPIQPYYLFVHWVSMTRLDLALEQFAEDAVVVAGPTCTPSSPCVGKAAIRSNYFDALSMGRVSLPLRDQRFDGKQLRTRGEQVHLGARLLRGGYVFEFQGGKIAFLRFEPDGSDPVVPRSHVATRGTRARP